MSEESARSNSHDEMLQLVAALPDQLAASSGFVPPLEALSETPSRIWLCGMGGSAVAGELLSACTEFGLPELKQSQKIRQAQ